MEVVYQYGRLEQLNHTLNQVEYIFPVIGGYRSGDSFELQRLIGTAFYIMNGFYVTSAHVIRQATEEHECMALGAIRKEGVLRYEIQDFECFEEHDFAIFRSDKSVSNSAFRWSFLPMSAGGEVITFGFPFGVDKTNFVHRVFKGYVNSHGKFSRFKDNTCYEVSFPCMAGLSGSFLLDEKNYLVRGIIQGSSEHAIETGDYEEEDGNKTIIFRETMKLGLAYSSENFMPLDSKLLGGSFKGYLQEHDLLA